MSIFPPFNFYHVFIAPWVQYGSDTSIVVLMGFLVAASCGLIGNFIILRKMALIGDAISHSLLPGIALAFLLTGARASMAFFIGAIIAGVITVVLIEFIQKHSKIKFDAAMGLVFSSLFALGVIIITFFSDHIDLDTDCVLYGEIAFVPLEPHLLIAGLNLGPYSIVRLISVLLIMILVLSLFYKEILLCTFDPILARCIGIKPKLFQYALTITLSLVVVSAFRSVGAILVIGMLLFPGCTARLMTSNLRKMLCLTIVFGGLYALFGFHLAMWLNCSIAGTMTVTAGLIFGVTWAHYAIKNRTISCLKN